MQEYPGFVYLDLQKTGSTFVNTFLREFAKDTALQSAKHSSIGNDYDPAKFHFITHRDPLDQYLSLYSYGCAGHGNFRYAMERRGHKTDYDGTAAGFSRWLNFVLDPENAAAIGGRPYVKTGMPPLAGYQTFRLLRLSFAHSKAVCSDCRTKEDLREAFRTKRIWQVALRTSELNAGLIELARGALAPHLKDIGAAVEFLKTDTTRNASARVDRQAGFSVLDKDKRLIEEREWLFFEELGYRRYTGETVRTRA